MDTKEEPAVDEGGDAASSEARVEARQSLPPSLRPRYHATRLLGEGTTGVAYEARDTLKDEDVVLKFLRENDILTDRNFLMETPLLMRLEHEHSCKIYDTGLADGRRFIVMQRIQGESLGAIRDRMSIDQMLQLIRAVADALLEAHEIGIVHGDIKPGNILVIQQQEGTFQPFLKDFTLSRWACDPRRLVWAATSEGIAFLAPEQVRGDSAVIDERTDVYGLGATFYYLLSGHPPFSETDKRKLVLRIRLLTEEAPLLRTVQPDIPQDVEAFIAKCLAKNPQRRYPSVQALIEDLDRLIVGEPLRLSRLPGDLGGPRLSRPDILSEDGSLARFSAPPNEPSQIRSSVLPDEPPQASTTVPTDKHSDLWKVGIGILLIIGMILIGLSLHAQCLVEDQDPSREVLVRI